MAAFCIPLLAKLRTVKQTLGELFSDPDEGLELRDEIQARLRKSLDEEKIVSAENIAAELSLEW